jgi:hypothetical protein
MTKGGFTMTFVPGLAIVGAAGSCTAAASVPVASYNYQAVPATFGTSGNRSFATSEAQTIFQDLTGAVITITTAGVASSGMPLK